MRRGTKVPQIYGAMRGGNTRFPKGQEATDLSAGRHGPADGSRNAQCTSRFGLCFTQNLQEDYLNVGRSKNGAQKNSLENESKGFTTDSAQNAIMSEALD
jgi:hypothetical protein